MSLSAALQIGRSGLLASQTAIDVAGNNLANVATRGYHRQTIALAPMGTQEVQQGAFVGRGVQVAEILRQVDAGLEGRVRSSLADEAGAKARQDVLSQIEALHNELSDTDLSSQLAQFFNAFSDLSGRPLDAALRGLVVTQGQALADYLHSVRDGLSNLRTQVDTSLNQAAQGANDLLTQVASLNRQIAVAEGSGGSAHDLRDQRDAVLADLAQYLDVSVVEQSSGGVDVYVGSLPVVLGGQSRGLEIRRETVDGDLEVALTIAADGSPLNPATGKLGALLTARRDDVDPALDQLDQFAHELIWAVNRIHSQGQGTSGYTSLTGEAGVADAAAALNSAAAGLDFAPTHGSFEIHVTQKSTGLRTTTRIAVDLDGINPAGDTTLNSLAAALGAVGNISASVTGDGRLRLATSSGDYELSFSSDTSGVLAALGLNTYFRGANARDINVSAAVRANSGLVAAGREHVSGDNRNALALAGLRDQGLAALGGRSLAAAWHEHVEDYAIRLGQVKQQVRAATVVRENLQAQQQSTSGVNADEEAINLLAYQRAYQASARFLTVVDQMMQTLLQLV